MPPLPSPLRGLSPCNSHREVATMALGQSPRLLRIRNTAYHILLQSAEKVSVLEMDHPQSWGQCRDTATNLIPPSRLPSHSFSSGALSNPFLFPWAIRKRLSHAPLSGVHDSIHTIRPSVSVTLRHRLMQNAVHKAVRMASIWFTVAFWSLALEGSLSNPAPCALSRLSHSRFV